MEIANIPEDEMPVEGSLTQPPPLLTPTLWQDPQAEAQ